MEIAGRRRRSFAAPGEEERGSITLETALVVPIFCALFMMLNSLFFVVSTQQQVTHALIQTGNSMAMDSYLTENVESAAENGTAFWKELSDMVIDIRRIFNPATGYFADPSDWYSAGNGAAVAKRRFQAYMTAAHGPGSQTEANSILKGLGLLNGMSDMHLSTNISGGEMTLTAEYKLHYRLNPLFKNTLPMKQELKVKLWGYDG